MIEAYEDTGIIGEETYSISYIGDITPERVNEYVDLCVVITEVADPFRFTSKKGSELVKRDITIADPSNCTVKLTLWNEQAENAPPVGSVVMAKRVRINDYQGQISVTYDRLHSEILEEPGISSLESV